MPFDGIFLSGHNVKCDESSVLLGGLGGPSTSFGNRMFGSFAATPAISQMLIGSGPGSGGSTSSFVKNDTGFDVFASQTTSSSFAAVAANVNKPISGFGAFTGVCSTSPFGAAGSASAAGNANVGATGNKPAPAFGSVVDSR